MKKLNITKEQFEKSKYFKDKYGKLEYVSESDKLFKTSKGKLLKFKEARMPRRAKPKMESFFVAGVNCVDDDTGEAQRFWFYEDALDWIQSEIVTEETQADEVDSGNMEFSVENVISELKKTGTAWCDAANVVFIKEIQYEDKYGSEGSL